MIKKLCYPLWITAVGVILGSGVTAVFAQEPFYRGKTIRIIVGATPGGGFDIYARVTARHMGKHIPGNPTIIVQNMPGAGHLIAANYVYKVAKPDGLTIGHFLGGLFMQQLLGRRGIEFDALKFDYIGAPVRDTSVCALTKASGVTSMEKWMASKAPIKLGGTAAGSATDDVPKILQVALALPIRLVTGYKATPEIRLAAEGGELDGVCMGWDAIKAAWRRAQDAGDVVIVLQAVPRAHPELPKIPVAINFAKTEEARELIQTGIHDLTTIFRPYTLPPGTPKQLVQMLRKAFQDTMKDPEFVADAMQSRLDIDPVSGEELERIVSGLFKLSPALVARLKEVLK